jgi:hypothetical protein
MGSVLQKMQKENEMKKPQPLLITEMFYRECTCDEYEWEEQVCPFEADVNNNPNATCNCCPYCTQICHDDI